MAMGMVAEADDVGLVALKKLIDDAETKPASRGHESDGERGEAGSMSIGAAGGPGTAAATEGALGTHSAAAISGAGWLVIHHRADEGPFVRQDIRGLGFIVHWPRFIQRRRHQDDRIRPLLPGYMLATEGLSGTWGAITDVPNVHGLVGARRGGKPARVADAKVRALIALAGGSVDGIIDPTPDSNPQVAPGDVVAITIGSREVLGICRQRDADRITIGFEFLGLERFVQVEAVKARKVGS